ncbi:hypothetical protein LX88_005262 [Lentzea californiensis]|nr:hypothetical protein [Lentzea californiensis]
MITRMKRAIIGIAFVKQFAGRGSNYSYVQRDDNFTAFSSKRC